jgi:uncharacterized protein (DUF2141 family)
LARGIYAVGTYHDENSNCRLDTDIIGYPTEGFALSNGIGSSTLPLLSATQTRT